jgi:hypothetical protein
MTLRDELLLTLEQVKSELFDCIEMFTVAVVLWCGALWLHLSCSSCGTTILLLVMSAVALAVLFVFAAWAHMYAYPFSVMGRADLQLEYLRYRDEQRRHKLRGGRNEDTP